MDHHHKPARLVVQSTKKMGCNAVAQIVEMARYPQFQVRINFSMNKRNFWLLLASHRLSNILFWPQCYVRSFLRI